MKYKLELEEAVVNKELNKKFLTKIQKDKNKKVDAQFAEYHKKAFQKIDCLQCSNCCKTTSPIFRDIDIKRISKKLKVSEKIFHQTYLRKDEEDDYVLQQSPCAFLGSDNKCAIYEDRPLACREFPHTDRKNMYQIMDLTAKNTLICPAVSQIVNRLRENLQMK